MIRGEYYIKPIESGYSRPHLIRCEDGQTYVVKLSSNPQGTMVLVNELISYRIALLLDLPVPQGAVILLDEEIITRNPELQRGYAQAGPHFGSLYIENAVNVTPDSDFSKADNIDKAADIILFDYWVNNNDRHIFNEANTNLLISNSLIPHLWMIDQANILKGPYWNERSISAHQPYISTYWGELYQKFVPSLDSKSPFEAALQKFESLSYAALKQVVSGVPGEWRFLDSQGRAVVSYLDSRLALLRKAIEAVRIHFPVWSKDYNEKKV